MVLQRRLLFPNLKSPASSAAPRKARIVLLESPNCLCYQSSLRIRGVSVSLILPSENDLRVNIPETDIHLCEHHFTTYGKPDVFRVRTSVSSVAKAILKSSPQDHPPGP